MPSQPERRVVHLSLPPSASATSALPLLSCSIAEALTQLLLIAKLHMSRMCVWHAGILTVYTATRSIVHGHVYADHTHAR